MRILITLSIVTAALSGCASSGVSMYSVPTQRRVCASTQNTQSISYEPIHVETLACDRNVSKTRQVEQQIAPSNQKSKSTPKKRPRKNKNILNEAMGVSYKLFKDSINYIKPKLPKIPGLGK